MIKGVGDHKLVKVPAIRVAGFRVGEVLKRAVRKEKK
jgi:hypothetical protein